VTVPEFGTPLVDNFPSTQTALKEDESCDVKLAHANITGDGHSYAD
jgi:hypothetical protein